jgi:ubiquinone biosynthesis protein COQ9
MFRRVIFRININLRTSIANSELKRHKFLTACFVEVNSNDLCIPQSHICARQLSIPSLALYSDKKIDDFRAREEEKEADFNKQPIEKEEKASKEESTNQEDEKVTEVKNKILEASLEFVSSAGWTRQAILKGAEKAGYPGTIHGMFPKGGIELINYFYLKCNKQLVETMKEKVAGIEKVEDPKQFVTWAIKERLIMIKPFISNWPQALAIMTLPPNVPTSLANMLTLVDDICYYSGDRSVDFNWYARRIGLATIYKATELYILQDSTPDNEATWKFLERRIADASLVHDVLIQSESATQHLSQAVTSAFTTARNILGLNFDRR